MKQFKQTGWWEEYRCGCISKTARTKRELLGYCPTHGEDARHQHRDYKLLESKTTKPKASK